MDHGSSNADPRAACKFVSHFLRDFGLGEGGALLRFD